MATKEKPNGRKIQHQRFLENKKKAEKLLAEGYSYRQIMVKLEYKSVASVQDLLADVGRNH